MAGTTDAGFDVRVTGSGGAYPEAIDQGIDETVDALRPAARRREWQRNLLGGTVLVGAVAVMFYAEDQRLDRFDTVVLVVAMAFVVATALYRRRRALAGDYDHQIALSDGLASAAERREANRALLTGKPSAAPLLREVERRDALRVVANETSILWSIVPALLLGGVFGALHWIDGEIVKAAVFIVVGLGMAGIWLRAMLMTRGGKRLLTQVDREMNSAHSLTH